MFEGALEQLLLKFLEPYVDGISRDKLHLGAFSGSLDLQDLAVKADALTLLGLEGFRVRRGKIKLIKVSVPWSRIYSGKLSVTVKQVHVEVETLGDGVISEAKLIQEMQEAKRKAIEVRFNQLHDLVEQQDDGQEGAAEQSKKRGMVVRLVRKIVNNITINLEDVSFSFINSTRQLACSLELGKLELRSTDHTFGEGGKGAEAVDVTDQSMYKRMNLQKLGLKMSRAKTSDLGKGALCVLSPISASLYLSHVPSDQVLSIRLEVATEERAEVTLRHSQVKHTRSVQAELGGDAMRLHALAVPPEEERAIYLDVAASRAEYARLYEKHLLCLLKLAPAGGEQPTDEEERRRQLLEDVFSVRFIARERWKVHRKVDALHSEVARRQEEEKARLRSEKAKSGGFFGRLRNRWGGGAATSTGADEGSAVWLAPEEQEQLLADIGDESKIERVDLPQRFRFEFMLGHMQVDLVDDRYDDDAIERRLLSLALKEANWQIDVRMATDHRGQDSAEWSTAIRLKSFQAEHAKSDLLKLHSQPDAETGEAGDAVALPRSASWDAARLDLKSTLGEEQNLLELAFHFQPLEIHLLPGIVESILEFVRPPEAADDGDAAGAGVDSAAASAAVASMSLAEGGDSRVEEYVEVSKQFLEVHGDRAKEVAQQVYARIPDKMCLDLRIASPILHVPVAGLGTSMFSLGQLRVSTPQPCEYSSIDLNIELNHTEMRAVSVRKERFDMIQPVLIAVAVEYRSAEAENTVNVTVKVAETVFSLAPQAVQILISTPTAIVSVLNPTRPDRGSPTAAAEPEADRPIVEEEVEGHRRPTTTQRAKELAQEVLGEGGQEIAKKVEDVRAKQFRLNASVLLDALNFTLADSIVPVMRFRAELIQPGLTVGFQKNPGLLSMKVENGALVVEVLNPRHGEWEPLAERFRFGFEFTRTSVNEDGRESRIVLIGHEPLLLNVTPTAARRASWIVPQFLENLEGSQPSPVGVDAEEASRALEQEAVKYRVVNICGVALQLCFQSRHAENLTMQVEPTGSQWQPLDDWVLPNFSTALTVSLPGGQPSEVLSLERACAVLVPGSGFVAEVLTHSPSHRLVLLTTPLRVHNRTDLTLSLRFHQAATGDALALEPARSTICDAEFLGRSPAGDSVRSQFKDNLEMPEAALDGLMLAPNTIVSVPAEALIRENQTCISTAHSLLSIRPAYLKVDFCKSFEVGSNTDSHSIFCRASKQDAKASQKCVYFSCESSSYDHTVPTPIELTTVEIQPTLALLNALPIGEMTVKYVRNGQEWTDAVEAKIPSFTRLNVYSFPGVRQEGISLIARFDDQAPWSSAPLHFSPDAFKKEVDATQTLKLKQSSGGAEASVTVEPLNRLEMRFACANWFVDRSGLGVPLQLLHQGQLLPCQRGITLLPAECMEEACELAMPPSSSSKEKCKGYSFRMPPSWSVLTWKPSSDSYVFCVQADDVFPEDVLGAQCQVMTLRPRLVFTNATEDELELSLDSGVIRLSPGSSTEHHWKPASGQEDAPQCSLRFRPLRRPIGHWSSTVLCGDAAAGSIPFVLPLSAKKDDTEKKGAAEKKEKKDNAEKKKGGVEVWTVEVAPVRGALAVSFRRGSDFVAVNRSKQADVRIALRPSDLDAEHESLCLPFGGQEVAYGWLKPLEEGKRRSVTVEVGEGVGMQTLRIEDVRLSMRRTLRMLNLAVIVTPMGTRTLLSIEDHEITVVDEEYPNNAERSVSSSSMSKGVIAGGSSLSVELKLGSLGLSIVEEVPVPRELLYVHFELIRLEWKRDHDLQQLKLAISEAQVDCQLPGRVDQHTLDRRRDESLGLLQQERPAVIFANIAEGDRAFLTLIMRRRSTSSRDMLIPFMDVAIDALDITVDDNWLDPLVVWVDAVRGKQRGGVLFEHLQRTAGQSIQVGYSPPPLPSVVQMDHLHIGTVNITMWCALKLMTVRFLPQYMRTAIKVLSFSGQFTLDSAHLKLEERIVPPHCGSLQDFVRGLMSEYTMNLIKNTGAMLGRSSFLNLPRVPLKLGMTSVSYMSDSLGLAFGEAASLLNQLTFDDDYLGEQRKLRSQKKILGVQDGVVEASKSVFQAVDGLFDVVRKPYEGAKEGGVGGFVNGFGKGLMGTFVKPVSNLGQAFSDVGSGLAASVAPDSASMKRRRMRPRLRQPRLLFSQAGIVRPWSETEAELLRQLGEGYTKGVEEVVTLLIQDNSCLVVLLFHDHLLLANLQEPGTPGSEAAAPGATRQRRLADKASAGDGGGGSSSSASAAASIGEVPAKAGRLDFFEAFEESAQRIVSHGLKPINTVKYGYQDLKHKGQSEDRDKEECKRAVRGELRFRELQAVHVAADNIMLEDREGKTKTLALGNSVVSKPVFNALAKGFTTAVARRHRGGVANWEELQAVLCHERMQAVLRRERERCGQSRGAGQRTLEVFEVERKIAMGSWQTPNLPTDIEMSWRWVDSSGHRHPHLDRKLTREQCGDRRNGPPCGLDANLFTATSEWVIDKDEGTDKEGWKYSMAWSSSTWDPKPGLFGGLRRRRWTRTYA